MLLSVIGAVSHALCGRSAAPFDLPSGETMTVPVDALTSALQQMQSMAAEAAGKTDATAFGQQAGAASSGSFAAALKNSLDKINAAQQKAGSESQAFELGAPNVSLSDVMVDGQKANISFQFGVQVRNKLVTAYNEIMQMAV
jgi:flagellar hook-basal body complex protein FliE